MSIECSQVDCEAFCSVIKKPVAETATEKGEGKGEERKAGGKAGGEAGGKAGGKAGAKAGGKKAPLPLSSCLEAPRRGSCHSNIPRWSAIIWHFSWTTAA